MEHRIFACVFSFSGQLVKRSIGSTALMTSKTDVVDGSKVIEKPPPTPRCEVTRPASVIRCIHFCQVRSWNLGCLRDASVSDRLVAAVFDEPNDGAEGVFGSLGKHGVSND